MSFSPILGNPKPQYEDAATGIPSVNGTLTFYEAGTSTLLDTYTDSGGGTTNDNPLTLNSRGEPENAIGGATMIYGDTLIPYKVILKDSAGATVWTIDDVYPGSPVSEWKSGAVATYVNANTFTLVGDQTATWKAGTPIKLTGGADRYASIGVSGFTTLTTITAVDIRDSSEASSTLHASMDTAYLSILTIPAFSLPRVYERVIDVSAYGTDEAALAIAYGLLPSTGGVVYFRNIGSSYTMNANAVALEQNWLNLAAGLDTHTALEMTKSNVKFVGEQGATLKLVSTNVGTEVSYIFANSKDTALTNISFYSLIIDLDTTGNATAAQARGILGVGITNFYVDRSVEFYSSTAKGGYSMEAWNCTNVEANFYAHNVSGVLNCIYNENIKTDIQIDTFNECVDLDKVNHNADIRVNCINGGECVDSNATIGGMYDITTRDCGRIFTSTPKAPFGATWADHIADTPLVHNNETDIDLRFVAYNCAYAKTTPSIIIGHSWSDSTHANVDPVSRIKISGTANKIGQIFVKEAKDLTFHDLLIDDILAPATGTTEGCLNIKSEGDWATYPDAELWSDLSVTFDNVKVRNGNRHGIHVDYPSKVVIRNVETNTTSTEAASVDSGVKITHIADRDAIIDIDGLTCANGYDGLNINANSGATSQIHLEKLDLTDGNSNIDFRLLDGEEYIHSKREYVKFGTIAAGTDDERLLLRLRRAGKILNVLLCNASDITQNDTDYSSYTLYQRAADGTGASQIISVTTELTGGLDFNAFSPLSLGQVALVADPQSVFTAGQVLTLAKTDTAAGQPSDEMMVEIEYIEF